MTKTETYYALDSFHLSGVGQFVRGNEISQPEAVLKDLEKRGLISKTKPVTKSVGNPAGKKAEEDARKAGLAGKQPEAKAKKDAPANKAVSAPPADKKAPATPPAKAEEDATKKSA